MFKFYFSIRPQNARRCLLCGVENLVQEVRVKAERFQNFLQPCLQRVICGGSNGQFEFSKRMPIGGGTVLGVGRVFSVQNESP